MGKAVPNWFCCLFFASYLVYPSREIGKPHAFPFNCLMMYMPTFLTYPRHFHPGYRGDRDGGAL